MSGHSKWATIKRQKGAADVKRGAAFTKHSNAITLAAKQGGSTDPSQNFKLRLAIEAAKTANMPKDTIDRAIARATGREESSIQELTYEGFAPGGVAVIVEAATDNPNRTGSEIKGIFQRGGASFGQPGSVSYMFQSFGLIVIRKDSKTFDEIFTIAVESGAQDVDEVGSEIEAYTSPQSLAKVRESLLSNGINVTSSEIIRKATNHVTLDEEGSKKVLDFLIKLDSLDDVQKVYSNLSD